MSSHPQIAAETEAVLMTVAAILGHSIESATPVMRGGNNRLYQIRCANKTYAAKFYPVNKEDPRDRLGTEYDGLSFLHHMKTTMVPRPIGQSRRDNCAVYEWIEGQPFELVCSDDIDAALAFVDALQKIERSGDALKVPMASEACMSAMTVCRQIETRLDMLRDAARRNALLSDYLTNAFIPAFSKITRWSQQTYQAAELTFSKPINDMLATLSPSDFGFHNALKRPDGAIVFLDFEYFGWDDPVKLTCDFILHPGMELGENMKHHFVKGMNTIFANDEKFRTRMKALYPLYGLRWCMILLNEFQMDRWKQRAYAGIHQDLAAAQSRQLAKAEALLSKTLRTFEGYPYGA
jgi:hypothetical protein